MCSACNLSMKEEMHRCCLDFSEWVDIPLPEFRWRFLEQRREEILTMLGEDAEKYPDDVVDEWMDLVREREEVFQLQFEQQSRRMFVHALTGVQIALQDLLASNVEKFAPALAPSIKIFYFQVKQLVEDASISDDNFSSDLENFSSAIQSYNDDLQEINGEDNCITSVTTKDFHFEDQIERNSGIEMTTSSFSNGTTGNVQIADTPVNIEVEVSPQFEVDAQFSAWSEPLPVILYPSSESCHSFDPCMQHILVNHSSPELSRVLSNSSMVSLCKDIHIVPELSSGSAKLVDDDGILQKNWNSDWTQKINTVPDVVPGMESSLSRSQNPKECIHEKSTDPTPVTSYILERTKRLSRTGVRRPSSKIPVLTLRR